jgi:hypothetical protein
MRSSKIAVAIGCNLLVVSAALYIALQRETAAEQALSPGEDSLGVAAIGMMYGLPTAERTGFRSGRPIASASRSSRIVMGTLVSSGNMPMAPAQQNVLRKPIRVPSMYRNRGRRRVIVSFSVLLTELRRRYGPTQSAIRG